MNKNPRKTALVHHTYTTKHQFNPEAKKVMKKVHSERTLKIHETNHIIMNEHRAVNFKSDAEHVTPEFYNLIKSSMKNRTVNHQKQQVNINELFDQDT